MQCISLCSNGYCQTYTKHVSYSVQQIVKFVIQFDEFLKYKHA